MYHKFIIKNEAFIMELINREKYLTFLKQIKNKPVIKVISGVRRSGKSTLFDLLRQAILAEDAQSNIISVNFDQLEYEELCDYKKLHQYVMDRIDKKRKNYIFLDEIQNVAQFEKTVDSLFIRKNVDIYITGSNAYFMSGELTTLLSGRYVELKILPLSFKEFYMWNLIKRPQFTRFELFNKYLEGSFPYVLFTEDNEERQVYLEGLFNTIVLNDIVTRKKILDVSVLQRVIETLFSMIGSEININKIGSSLRSQSVKITNQTIERWLEAILDSFIMYKARKFDIHGRKLLETNQKLYVVDNGLRSLKLRDHLEDRAHILENIVFLELKRRGFEVYIGKVGKYEVDFVTIDMNGDIEYYQVSESTISTETLEREIRSLRYINDNFPKYLLTLDDYMPAGNFDGIKKLNVIDWLLDDDS